MASYLTNKVAKHVLSENASNHLSNDDPYFEYVAATDAHGGATGKKVKRKRAIPPGLTKQEEKILKKVTRRAHRLDNCFNVCGVKIGWSAVVGIIPGAGDLVDALMAFMVVWVCTQANIPQTLKSRMVLNIALDFAVGLVPILGDVADAFFRCNSRNAALLRNHLQARGAARIRDSASKAKGISQTDIPSQAAKPQQISNVRQANPSDQGNLTKGSIHGPNEAALNEKAVRASRMQSLWHSTAESSLEPEKAALAQGRTPGRGGWLTRFGGNKQAATDLENGDNARQ